MKAGELIIFRISRDCDTLLNVKSLGRSFGLDIWIIPILIYSWYGGQSGSKQTKHL